MRRGQLLLLAFITALLKLFTNDIVAQLHALVTDVDGGTGYQLANFVLALAAEITME